MVNLMKKVAKLENRLKDKLFLLATKYIPHFLALGYVVYTLFEFLEIESIIIGYFVHLSIFPWIYLYSASWRFKFCYVHRIPLYYIATNEILTIIDNYIGLPLGVFDLLVLHIVIIGVVIYCYSYYYIKLRK